MKTLSVACLNAGVIFCLIFKPAGEKQAGETQIFKNVEFSSPAVERDEALILLNRVREARGYIEGKNFSTRYCFLIDMGIHCGKKRFFVYDLLTNKVVYSGLVSHGSGGVDYSLDPKFSNGPGSGCSSLGKYRVGEVYYGQYGKSYKLYGLESSNSNAYRRAVVLHGYNCVPDEEIYPKGICNTSGCAGVSPNFLKQLSTIIDESQKPILLWIFL
jgi:hypothetical protein